MNAGKKITWKMVRSVAKEKGLKFKRRTARNYEGLAVKGLDPDIVYFVDSYQGRPMVIPPNQKADGMLYYQKRRTVLCLADTNLSPRVYIGKFLQDDQCTCEVCFEDVGDREGKLCCKCLFRMCDVCQTKYALTDMNVSLILSGRFVTNRRCPGCRFRSEQDSRSDYHQVLDRLDMFSIRQQEALLAAKRNDPLAEQQMTLWVEKHPLRYYKEGVFVKLHGLQARPKWNGKIAKIIGESTINNKDQLRWPIQRRGSKQRASMKQNNMMPTEEEIGSEGLEFYKKHFPNPSGIECCALTQEFVIQQMMSNFGAAMPGMDQVD